MLMFKLISVLALGAAFLLASAVWSGTVLQTKLNRLEPLSGSGVTTFSGSEMGPIRLVP